MLPGQVFNKETSCLQGHLAIAHILCRLYKNLHEALHPVHIPRTRPNDLPEDIPHAHRSIISEWLHPHKRYYPQVHLLNKHPNFGLCFLAVNLVFIRRSKSSLFVCCIAYWLTLPSSSAQHAMGVLSNQTPLPANSRCSANQIFVDAYMARPHNVVTFVL